MEISNEIKAKIFAKYLGQNVKHKVKTLKNPDQWDERGTHILDTDTINMCLDPDYGMQIILKPISSITDEDAIEVAKLFPKEKYALTAETGKRIIGGMFNVPMSHNGCLMAMMLNPRGLFAVNIYQYLQSRGYDLPHYLLSGKTLKEAGLAVYETITND